MRVISWKALLAVALFLFTGISFATVVLDQNNPTVGGGFCRIGSNLCGQSFQQDHNNISGAGIFLDTSWLGSENITLSIYENYSSSPFGLIASATSGLVNETSGWVEVFWTPTGVTTSAT